MVHISMVSCFAKTAKLAELPLVALSCHSPWHSCLGGNMRSKLECQIVCQNRCQIDGQNIYSIYIYICIS
jgi:hypothetical protein